MILLNNKWEELRSALAYYKFASVSDEEDIIYQTNGIADPILVGEQYGCFQHIKLRRDIFHTRTIPIWHGDVRRTAIWEDNGDMEVYEITTEDSEKLILTLWGVKEDPKHLVQFKGKISVSDLVNPKVWNHDMCYYNTDTNTAALGVDMFRFDLSSCDKKYKHNGKIMNKSGMNDFCGMFMKRSGGRKVYDFMDCDYFAMDVYVPAWIIEHSETGENIYLDVINAYTGKSLTYQRVKPQLSEAEIKEIHSFVSEMKAAYRLLLEPDRKY